MNHAQLPAHALRPFPSLDPGRSIATQFIPNAPKPVARLTPMGLLKLFLTQCILASAMTLSDAEQWRLFGGLLFGGVIGGMCGMLLVAISGVRVPWQIYAGRFAANALGSLGLGAIGLYISINTFGMSAGPLLTVGHGFTYGLIGVAAFKAAFEKKLLDRLAKMAGMETTNQVAASATGNDAAAVVPASPPTVNLAPQQSPKI